MKQNWFLCTLAEPESHSKDCQPANNHSKPNSSCRSCSWKQIHKWEINIEQPPLASATQRSQSTPPALPVGHALWAWQILYIMFWQYVWNHACTWVWAFEQLQGRPEGRRQHPCHPGMKASEQPCPCCGYTRYRCDHTCQCQSSTTDPVPFLQEFLLMGKAPSSPTENQSSPVQQHSRHYECRNTPQSGA